MRKARIKADSGGFYHVMSRAIEGRSILGSAEKEKFIDIMRKMEAFCGIRILTHATMTTHFHLLIHVPARRALSDEELVQRLGILYEPPLVKEIAAQLADSRKEGLHEQAERIKAKYTYRMYDLSEYMKTLKQRFTQYYNKREGRKGPLWEQRFKSILVQDSQHALCTMAAYIDLNPFRAGLVKDPKDYRYCGYGEAIAGSKVAREGLAAVIMETEASWSQTAREYRKFLYMQGEEKGVDKLGQPLKRGFSKEQVQAVLDAGGNLPMHDILRCRVRYFSDGLVLGSRDFVEGVFAEYRSEFGLKRKNGARPMKFGQWNGLCTMRDLRKQVVSA